MARTVYDEYSVVPPTFDYSLRKIVSYTAVNHSADFYQDYEAGHGTHVAGIVVGEIYNTSEPIVFGDELGTFLCQYYTNASNWVWDDDYTYNASNYTASTWDDDFYGPNYYCENVFCETCVDAYLCDQTCGRIASNKTNAYTGMAPKAQVNAFDVGDAYGNLHIPDDYYGMFLDGLMAGAKFHSNSWGSSPPYNWYDYGTMTLDTFMYDNPEQLVLVAAGNEGSSSGYDYLNKSDLELMFGDASIIAPAGAKNCLTVGAAETKETPDTVATFSSRGPYNDGRIKPDVCGPGNPVSNAPRRTLTLRSSQLYSNKKFHRVQFGTLRVYVIHEEFSALNFTSVKVAKLSSQTLRKSSSFRTLRRLHELAKLSTLITFHVVQFIQDCTTTLVMHQAPLMLPLHLHSFSGVNRV